MRKAKIPIATRPSMKADWASIGARQLAATFKGLGRYVLRRGNVPTATALQNLRHGLKSAAPLWPDTAAAGGGGPNRVAILTTSRRARADPREDNPPQKQCVLAHL